MASMSNIITKLDDQFTHLLSSWNLYTTVLSILIISYVTYILFNWDEPDVHPFLLARQSHASPVRHEGESATYRSLQTPHGYPLRTALDARDPNAWSSSGRKTSDLRGIWNQAAGGVSGEGDGKGVRGKIFTVRGKQEIFEHSFGMRDAVLGVHVRITVLLITFNRRAVNGDKRHRSDYP